MPATTPIRTRCTAEHHVGPWTPRPEMTAWLRQLAHAARMDLVVAEQGHCLACHSDTALPLGAVIVVETAAAVAA